MSEPPTQPTDELPDLLPEERTERALIVRVALLVATGVLFILAIILWLVPVLTGIPFWILGIVTLGMASRRAARWINARERRLPRKIRLVLRPRLRRELRERDEATDATRGTRRTP
jgi:hypothetical protein